MRNIFRLGLLASVLVLTGCGDLDQPNNEQVVGGEIVVNVDALSVKDSLIEAGAIPADYPGDVYGYKAYKVPYTTTDEEGNAVSVSGLMVIPTGLPDVVYDTLGLSLVSDSHGTIFADREAPSVIASTDNLPDGSALIISSLGGFVTLQADYIGFGDSKEHYHPFILKKSLANATVDFIKAAQVFASNNSINLNGQLFLTGYSEGGYAALATLKKIEIEGDTGLTVTLAAPMAGPYAVEALALSVLSAETLSVPSFMANVGYAYGLAHNEDIESIVNAPYASELETLFNGDFNRTQIDPELTHVTTGDNGLFVQEFVTSVFADTNYWFRKAARDNDVHTWAPQTTVRLVHCQGDEVIPFDIALLAEGTMNVYGAADVEIIPVEAALGLPVLVGHADCGSLAYKVTTNVFAGIRQATIGY
ncbi:MAG: hypothetical protein DRQ78_11650 [Epsilonproteobacteria bacterium]|nr:MAG: hypothetical protein DRQ78_11650 [Campylobacterota bacterium]